MLAHRRAPERMVEVVPQARLILLLRNPIDRAYSLYHHWARNGVESLTFEEVLDAEKTWLLEISRHGHHDDVDDVPFGYLSRSIYVESMWNLRGSSPPLVEVLRQGADARADE